MADWIGYFGVAILLVAYFLNVTKKISSEGYLYLILNILGAGLAWWSVILLKYIPFIILEGAWTCVSIYSLIKLILKK